ncbi:Zn-ribbon domain-containing OB-fold protein [Mycolicibacterium moriokaense]|uniref:Putative OB-fold protein n=1 Tax=Mycolicibacterium moriokaense TaxID=39691 RepID=A0A318HG24_9MYCO|nr:OB-fold domain-containing protein [Mycolicibacterium moriokaense]PXX01668.1 putative OB-fold protein [Mycolicibacterium moriokaense]
MIDPVSDEDLIARFPGEPITHDNKVHYRGRLQRRLLINRCAECGRWHQPHRPVCPHCWSRNVVATDVSGAGTIHLAIFLHQGPPAGGVDYSTPYPVVTVDLDDAPGVRFTATVVGPSPDRIVIGARVHLDWVQRGGSPMPVFRLGGGTGS